MKKIKVQIVMMFMLSVFTTPIITSAQTVIDTNFLLIKYPTLNKPATGHYIKNGVRYPMSNFSDLRHEFVNHPKSLDSYKRARSNEAWSFSTSLLSHGLAVGGVILLANQLDKNVINRDRAWAGLSMIMVGTVIQLGIAEPLRTRSINHINDAVHWRMKQQ